MGKTWDDTKGAFINTPKEMSNFFKEINELCKKYNFSISHEDYNGAFIIEDYNKDNIEWLKAAHKNYDVNNG